MISVRIIGSAGSKGKAEDGGIGTMLIIGRASPDRFGAKAAIKAFRGLVARFDLEEKLGDSCKPEPRNCGGQKRAGKALAAVTRLDGQGQDFGLTGGGSRDQETVTGVRFIG